MNQNEMLIMFSSENTKEGASSCLRLRYLFTKEKSLNEKELYPEFCQLFSSFEHEKMAFKSFDELRSFISHMGMVLGKSNYRFVSISQFNNKQKEFETAEHFKAYFDTLKSFEIGRDTSGQKGFFEKLLSF